MIELALPSTQPQLVAVFIDVENVQPWIRSDGLRVLMDDLAENYDTVALRRAYADWKHCENVQRILNRWGYDLAQVYHPVKGKNSADIQIVVDAMDTLARRPEINVYVLATGDSDFSPLFRRLRERGKTVVGVGPESPLSETVQSSCSRFLFTSRRVGSTPRPALQLDPRRIAVPPSPTAVTKVPVAAIAATDRFVPPAGEPVMINRLKQTLMNSDPTFGSRVVGSCLRFLQSNPGEWRVFEAPQGSGRWMIERSDPSAIASAETAPSGSRSSVQVLSKVIDARVSVESPPQPTTQPTAELYTSFLQQKNWSFADRADTLEVYSILDTELKGHEPMTRQEAVDAILEHCEEDTPESRVDLAIRVLAACGVAKREHDGLDTRFTTPQGLTEEQVLDAHDIALLARLHGRCAERDVELDVQVAAPLMLGADNPARLEKIGRAAEVAYRQHQQGGD